MAGEMHSIRVTMTTLDPEHVAHEWQLAADRAEKTTHELAREMLCDALQEAAKRWTAEHPGVLAAGPDVW